MAVDRTDVADVDRFRARARRRIEVGDAQAPRGRAPDRTRRRRRRARRRRRLRRSSRRSPATTCALVTTSPLVDDPAAALLDLAAGATADLHDRLRGPAGRSRPGSAASGGSPGSGGSSSGAERGRVRRVGDRATPRRELRRLRRAPTSSRTATTAEPRAMRAGQPLRGRERRDRHPDERQHTERADRGTCESVPASAAGARRRE